MEKKKQKSKKWLKFRHKVVHAILRYPVHLLCKFIEDVLNLVCGGTVINSDVLCDLVEVVKHDMSYHGCIVFGFLKKSGIIRIIGEGHKIVYILTKGLLVDIYHIISAVDYRRN